MPVEWPHAVEMIRIVREQLRGMREVGVPDAGTFHANVRLAWLAGHLPNMAPASGQVFRLSVLTYAVVFHVGTGLPALELYGGGKHVTDTAPVTSISIA